MPPVQIYVSCHKPWSVYRAPHFVPIHVGRAAAARPMRKAMKGYLGDDTGDNLSSKNDRYAELTAQYWVWKNLSRRARPEFVGFFHYRRSLALRFAPEDAFTTCVPDEATAERFAWSLEGLVDVMSDLDLVGFTWHIDKNSVFDLDAAYQMMTPERWALHAELPQHPTLYDHYRLVHRQQDLDLALEILQRRGTAPAIFRETIESTSPFFLNMFVMRWTLFDEYCRWLFPILFEVEKVVELTPEGFPEGFQRRVLGFLGERLLNVFIAERNARGETPLRIAARPFVFVDEVLHPLTTAFDRFRAAVKRYPVAHHMARQIKNLLRGGNG